MDKWHQSSDDDSNLADELRLSHTLQHRPNLYETLQLCHFIVFIDMYFIASMSFYIQLKKPEDMVGNK